jgi:hypothetical protein
MFWVQGGALASQYNSLGTALGDVGHNLGGAGDNAGEATEAVAAGIDPMEDAAAAETLSRLNFPALEESVVAAMAGLLALGRAPLTTRSGRVSRRSSKYSGDEYTEDYMEE